jgi:acyl carrier protein
MDSVAEAGDGLGGVRWISVGDEGIGPELIQRALSAAPAAQVQVSGPRLARRPVESNGAACAPSLEPPAPAPAPEPVPTAAATHARPNLQRGYVAPREELEREQVVIWEELLGITGIGVKDNFFELGGSSLLATQLITRIRGRFGAEVALAHLFDGPTVAAMSEAIRAIEAGEPPPVGDCAVPASDEDIVAATLSEIEALKDDEVRAQLVESLRDEGSAE